MRVMSFRVTAALADQFVVALSSASLTLLALVLLDRSEAGLLILTVAMGYFALGINRAFIGDVLLVLAPPLDEVHRARLIRQGMSASIWVSAIASATLLAVQLTANTLGHSELDNLALVAIVLPAVLGQDTARFASLSRHRPQDALRIDLIFFCVQVAIIAVLASSGSLSAGDLIAAWGGGAVAGLAWHVVRGRTAPLLTSPTAWIRRTHQLSVWFTVTGLLAQVHAQMVNFIVLGRLSAADLSGLRGSQAAVLQPIQNLSLALYAVLVPRAARWASSPCLAAKAKLVHETVMASLILLVFGVVTMVPLAILAMDFLGSMTKFADMRDMIPPVTVQAGVLLIQVPYGAALRGLGRARRLFVQHVFFTVASLSGLVLGATNFGAVGALWGLSLGAAAGLLTMIVFFGHAIKT